MGPRTQSGSNPEVRERTPNFTRADIWRLSNLITEFRLISSAVTTVRRVARLHIDQKSSVTERQAVNVLPARCWRSWSPGPHTESGLRQVNGLYMTGLRREPVCY